MSNFLQPDITGKQLGWSVETRDAGTCFVPGDVLQVPDFITPGKPIDSTYGLIFDALVSDLADYVEGRQIQSIEVCRGYFARLSAPGYMDCTEWSCYSTIKEARDALRDGD